MGELEKMRFGQEQIHNTHIYEQVFSTHRDRLYRLAAGILGNPSDAEDVLQITAIKCWQNSKQLRDLEVAPAWLTRIVVNACRDVLRRRKRQPQKVNNPDMDVPVYDQHWVEFEAMVSHLPERQREFVILKFGMDLTFKEIAFVSGAAESTVKYQLGRAIHQLRKGYGQKGGG